MGNLMPFWRVETKVQPPFSVGKYNQRRRSCYFVGFYFMPLSHNFRDGETRLLKALVLDVIVISQHNTLITIPESTMSMSTKQFSLVFIEFLSYNILILFNSTEE